jgi:ribosome maturation factor RimP
LIFAGFALKGELGLAFSICIGRNETMRQTFEEMLSEIIRPEVEGLGYRLWGISSPPTGKRRIIRIYIDGPDGVHIDQCARVSRQVSLMLEVEDIIPGAFVLEVSSPGLERRFFEPDQLKNYIGKQVSIKLFEAINECRKFQGDVTGVEGDTITLSVNNENIDFAWNSIKEARLIHEF